MSLFCRVKHQENISDERNFESFGNAMLLLFQVRGTGRVRLRLRLRLRVRVRVRVRVS